VNREERGLSWYDNAWNDETLEVAVACYLCQGYECTAAILNTTSTYSVAESTERFEYDSVESLNDCLIN
jgi:hypothetical protein